MPPPRVRKADYSGGRDGTTTRIVDMVFKAAENIDLEALKEILRNFIEEPV